MTPEVLARNDASPSPSHSEAPASAAVGGGSRFAAFLSWLRRAAPTALILLALGGLALWGHHTGWTVPKFSWLTGGAKAEADDWCGEHSVPESECVECNPDLLPRGKEQGWCKQHGIAECPLDHPEVAQLRGKPDVSQEDFDRAKRALGAADRPENNSKCKLHLRRVQFASKEVVERVGVEVAPAWRSPVVEFIAANGEITYDQTRVARLSTRVPGTAAWVGKGVGDPVKKGDVLALIDAAEVGRAKAEFLQAVALLGQKARAWEIVEDLIKSGTYRRGAGQELDAKAALRDAEIRLASAEQALLNLGFPVKADELRALSAQELRGRLQFLGLPDEIVKSPALTTPTSNLFPVRATLDGVVVTREVVAGEVVDTSKPLFVVADVSRMWLTLDVRHEDTKRLALGQPVRFRLGGGVKEKEIDGKLAWISTAVDEKTRTVKVRADLPNPEGRLRAYTFGTGKIVLREEKGAIVVPNDAVQWEGCCHVVFVRDKDFLKEGSPKVFHVREVRVGVKDDQNTEVIAGVLPGEIVAAKGSGVLRAELLKGNLGEG